MIRSIQNFIPKIVALAVQPKEQDRLQALLRTAIYKNDFAQAKLAIDQGAPINRQDLKDERRDYHIVRSAYYRTNDISDLLIKSGVNVNATCEHGHTPVIVASSGRYNHPLIRALLLAKADVHHKDNEGKTALMEAAACQDLITVGILTKAGANLSDQDLEGRTPLYYALVDKPLLNFGSFLVKREAKIKKLIDPTSVNLADKDGITPLMLAAVHGEHSTVKLLIANGSDLKAENQMGQKAHKWDDESRMRWLFPHKMNPQTQDDLGRTALEIAQNQKRKKEELIQKYDEIISLLKDTPGNNLPLERSLLTHDHTELGGAIFFNQIDEVQKLLRTGANIHKFREFDGPYLNMAARKGRLEIVRILLEHRANPSLVSHRGETALEEALAYRELRLDELENLDRTIAYLITPTLER